MNRTASGALRRRAPITPADPAVFVGFGASGDLTRRKLIPALVNLRRTGALSDNFAFLAITRAPDHGGTFARDLLAATDEHLADTLSADERGWFTERITVVAGDLEQPPLYDAIAAAVETLCAQQQTRGNVLFYLATPPQLFGPIATGLGRIGLLDEDKAGGWRRVIVEKPFGHDLESARALNTALAGVMQERQVYRIDHYLGKETVQNLMIFRFANSIFEPIWNRRYVDHVQITVAESDGIGTRGGYYDQAGALRDMVQSHLFMLLALTAMEPPISFDADAVRDERLKVLQAIAPYTPASVERDVVRGQYVAGRVKNEEVRGYIHEDKVLTGSTTETLVALRLQVENWRWAGVPFYLRTGKRMARRVSEIAVHFKQPPFMMFRDTCVTRLNANVLVIRVQPDEGITLLVDAKVPGQTLDLQTVAMDFKYDEAFEQSPSTGYETLLYDALTGDQTLFHRADSTEVGWRAVMPILEAWQTQSPPVSYDAGSWGPEEAHELLERDGRSWRRP